MKKHNAIIRSASILTASVLLLGTSFISCKTDEPAPQSTKVGQILITDIDGENSTTYVEQGDFITLQAQVLPEDASDKTIVWETSDSDILSVSQDGKITANTFTENPEEERTATVKALAQDGSDVSAEITVRVLPKTKHVSSIDITSKYSDSILKDESTILTIKILPEDAADKTFKITSSDPNILSIVKDEEGNYLATGNARGEAKIIVTANDRYQNTRKTEEYQIKVLGEKIDLEEISLAASNLVIEQENIVFTNQSSKISLIKTPEDATLSRENGIIFSITQGDDIATIDDDGTVTFGENAGQVTVNASATDRSGNTKEANLTFTVRKPVSQIKITKPENVKTETETENNEIILLSRDDYDETEESDNVLNLGANITPDDASVKTLIWESSNPDIAQVNENGTVSAKAAGNVTITAKSTDGSNISATQKIRVFVPVTKITVTAENTKGDVNTNIQLSVSVEPSDANADAKFEITSGLGSVSDEGLVTLGETSGDVTILVTSLYNENKTAQITLHAMPDKSELRNAVANAEKIWERSVYSDSAKATFKTAIDSAKEEITNEDNNEDAVNSAIESLNAASEIIKTDGIEKWDVSISRGGNSDQSVVKFFWSNETYALDETKLVFDGTTKFKAFTILTGETKVTSHNFWPNQPVVEGKSLITNPAFAEDALAVGEHTLFVTVSTGDNDDEYEIKVPFSFESAYNAEETDESAKSAKIGNIEISLVDKRIKARETLQKEINAATFTLNNANSAKFEEGALDEYQQAIQTAQNALENLQSESATLEDINTAINSLKNATELLQSKKLISKWDVEILRRTNDQSTITVKWQAEEWKLNAKTSFVASQEGENMAYTAFKVDNTVSHCFYPDAEADFVTAENYVSVKPAFNEPALNNGNHTLKFTVLADDENEYEITVSFTLAGTSNTDETQAVIDDVEVNPVDKLAKAKSAFLVQIEEAQTLLNSANENDYAEGALTTLETAITTARSSCTEATSIEQVQQAAQVFSQAVSTFKASAKIENWKVEVRQHDNDQYTVVVSWSKDDFKIKLDSVSNGNATFVTDGKPSHTYWPTENNKEEDYSVTFNPANNQLAGENALGEHTLVFDLQPVGSDTIYDITVVYNLTANDSWAQIISTTVTPRTQDE